MASQFLNSLKKTVETGEFNSEAAKKIIEISELADSKVGSTKAIDDAIEVPKKEGKIQTVTEQEAAAINGAYEEKMANIKKQDAVNLQIAALIDFEDVLSETINEMFAFISELETKFEKEFEEEDPLLGDLYLKITTIKTKYNKIK